MLPSLMLLQLGGRHRFWLPLPAVLLWPLWLIGWLFWSVLWICRSPWARSLRSALLVPAHLSGLRVDVDSADGQRIHLRVI